MPKKKTTEAQKLADWLESDQAGLMGDDRVKRAADLLREQNQCLKELVSAVQSFGEANYFEDEDEKKDSGETVVKAVLKAQKFLKEIPA